MAAERLSTLLSSESYLGDGNPRPRSSSVIDRDTEQVVTELETSDEGHRLSMAEIHRAIDQLDAETELLSMAGDVLDHDYDSTLLRISGLPHLGPPSLPIEESFDGDRAAPLTRPGARFVDQLPDIDLNDFPTDTSCNICMDPFGSTDDPESPVQLPCGHVMGRSCISKWLETSNSCPICRRVLFEQEAWGSPLTETELSEVLEMARALLLETSRLGTLTRLSGLFETTRLRSGFDSHDNPEDAVQSMAEDVEDVEMEFIELIGQQAVLNTRLAGYEADARDRRLTPERRLELRELMEDNEEFRRRLESFRLRHGELMESRGIQLPRVGRFFVGS